MIDVSKQKTKKYYQHCKDCKYKNITTGFEQAVCTHATQTKNENSILINNYHVQDCKKNKWKKEKEEII